jgi:hypothetical protein
MELRSKGDKIPACNSIMDIRMTLIQHRFKCGPKGKCFQLQLAPLEKGSEASGIGNYGDIRTEKNSAESWKAQRFFHSALGEERGDHGDDFPGFGGMRPWRRIG